MQYSIKFPDSLYERLRAEARRNGRSVNRQILTIVGQALDAAAPELWAVYVEGPDDMIPMSSLDAAAETARAMNDFWVSYEAGNPDPTGMRPTLRASVVPWPDGADDHAMELARLAAEEAAAGRGRLREAADALGQPLDTERTTP